MFRRRRLKPTLFPMNRLGLVGRAALVVRLRSAPAKAARLRARRKWRVLPSALAAPMAERRRSAVELSGSIFGRPAVALQSRPAARQAGAMPRSAFFSLLAAFC